VLECKWSIAGKHLVKALLNATVPEINIPVSELERKDVRAIRQLGEFVLDLAAGSAECEDVHIRSRRPSARERVVLQTDGLVTDQSDSVDPVT
jgi:hypothetical protein